MKTTTTRFIVLALLTGIACAHAETHLYDYDPNGNLKTDESASGIETNTFDPLDRLDTQTRAGITRNYDLDANGNRTQITIDGIQETFTYAPNTNRLTQANVVTDATGRITQDGPYTYTYNYEGRLKTVSKSGVLQASYVYNHVGQRTKKLSPQGATTNRYDYDQTGKLIVDKEGLVYHHYVYLNDQPIAHIRSDAQDEVAYLHTDHLGTPRVATGPNQDVLWQWQSDAFGTEPAQQTYMAVNLRMPGQYYDPESGLFYNHHRYYNPLMGRYLTSDPVGLAGGLNTYGYVGGNPLGFVDPSGLSGEREPAVEMREPTVQEQLAAPQVAQTLFRIRQVDPSYRYATMRPIGRTYNRSDVQYLREILRQKEAGNICRIYSAHELIRRSEDPGPNHNFPEVFNPSIFDGQRTEISPTYTLYSQRGALNGRSGTYEIGVAPHGTIEIITHRVFIPDK